MSQEYEMGMDKVHYNYLWLGRVGELRGTHLATPTRFNYPQDLPDKHKDNNYNIITIPILINLAYLEVFQ